VTHTVVIAEDHTLVREGLARALAQAGFDVVAQAADGEEAVEMTLEHRPDLVLMDLSLPVLSGVAATAQIRRRVPETAVLVLSMLSDETAVTSALDAGAGGYMVKDCSMDELVDAATRVADGERVMSASVSPVEPGPKGGAEDRPPAGASRPSLTKREEEVLRLLATGVSIREAARQLFISVKTVKNHLASIYQKLDAHDRSQAVLKAVRMGLIRLN
jgi:two-component system, NarL family, response regulator DegU